MSECEEDTAASRVSWSWSAMRVGEPVRSRKTQHAARHQSGAATALTWCPDAEDDGVAGMRMKPSVRHAAKTQARERRAQSCGEAAASGNSTRACQRLGRRLGRARQAQVFVCEHVNVVGRAQQQYEGGVEERAEVVGEDAAGRARGCGPGTSL